jgi:hypothetical protein
MEPISAGIASCSIGRIPVARASAGAAIAGEFHATLVAVKINATASAADLIPKPHLELLFMFILYVPFYSPKVGTRSSLPEDLTLSNKTPWTQFQSGFISTKNMP